MDPYGPMAMGLRWTTGVPVTQGPETTGFKQQTLNKDCAKITAVLPQNCCINQAK